MKKQRIVELAVKVIVAALTAFLTRNKYSNRRKEVKNEEAESD